MQDMSNCLGFILRASIFSVEPFSHAVEFRFCTSLGSNMLLFKYWKISDDYDDNNSLFVMILLHVSENAFGNCLQPDFPHSRLLSGWLSFIFALSNIFVNSTFSFLYHFQHFQLLSKLVVFIKRLTPGVSYYNIKVEFKVWKFI